MKIYTKDSLIAELREIANQGWIDNARHGSHQGRNGLPYSYDHTKRHGLLYEVAEQGPNE